MAFVNSMSVVFLKGAPDVYIRRVAEVMRLANRHSPPAGLARRASRRTRAGSSNQLDQERAKSPRHPYQ
jgi:protein gp37